MGTKYSFGIVAALAFLGLAVQYPSDVYGASTGDYKQDVNLNVIYIGTKSQKDSEPLSEIVLQLPFPLTETASETGQGLFGGITYFDAKTLVNDKEHVLYEFGLGRVYYNYAIPGEKPYTFVPYLTFVREFVFNYLDTKQALKSNDKGYAFLVPGVMYAYRFDEKWVGHFDAELYSYSKYNNNRARFGLSYSPEWPWIISVSHERIAWDAIGRNAIVSGISRENSIKLIFRDPPQGNFALTVGFGNQNRNIYGNLEPPMTRNSRGTYFGIEASGGILAW